jgi:hypothetical protein
MDVSSEHERIVFVAEGLRFAPPVDRYCEIRVESG